MAGSRHSAADMQIIRAARKASQSIATYMEQLGDDMQDDDDDTEIKSMEIGEEFNTRQRMLVSALIEVTHEAGKFDISASKTAAKGATLQMVDANNRYVGPIVLAKEALGKKTIFYYQT